MTIYISQIVIHHISIVRCDLGEGLKLGYIMRWSVIEGLIPLPLVLPCIRASPESPVDSLGVLIKFTLSSLRGCPWVFTTQDNISLVSIHLSKASFNCFAISFVREACLDRVIRSYDNNFRSDTKCRPLHFRRKSKSIGPRL